LVSHIVYILTYSYNCIQDSYPHFTPPVVYHTGLLIILLLIRTLVRHGLAMFISITPGNNYLYPRLSILPSQITSASGNTNISRPLTLNPNLQRTRAMNGI